MLTTTILQINNAYYSMRESGRSEVGKGMDIPRLHVANKAPERLGRADVGRSGIVSDSYRPAPMPCRLNSPNHKVLQMVSFIL